jgi:hypothetical protein
MEQLIREIEKLTGSAVQVTVERPDKVAEFSISDDEYLNSLDGVITTLTKREVYGLLTNRSCEVVLIPTEDDEVRHDISIITGKYDSLVQLRKRIASIPNIWTMLHPYTSEDLHQGLLAYLKNQFKVEEGEHGIYHGGVVDWYFIDGSPLDIEDWKENKPALYNKALEFLKNNEVPFFFNHLNANFSGVYLEEYGFRGHDNLLVAEVKLDLLT